MSTKNKVLIALLLYFQFNLWFGSSNVLSVVKLRNELTVKEIQLEELLERNNQVIAEVDSLKSGTSVIEDLARNELGMIKSNEIFYQIIEVP